MTLLLVPHEVASDRIELWVGALDEPAAQPASLAVAVVGVPGSTPVGHWDGTVTWGPEASPSADSRSPGSCRARDIGSSCDGMGSRSATRSPRPSRWTFRAWTSDRSRSCSGRVSRDPPTAPGMPGVPTRNSRLTPRATSRSCAAIRSTSTSRRPSSWSRPTTRTNFASATWGTMRTRGARREAFASCFGSEARTSARTTTISGTVAPNPTIIARDTWFQQGRDDWKAAAKALYGAFQRPVESATAAFRVGTLSFFVADTRLDRTTERDAFATDAELVAIENWLAGR